MIVTGVEGARRGGPPAARRRPHRSRVPVALLALSVALAATAPPAAAGPATDRMLADVALLAASPREAGTAAERAALEVVAARLRSLGLPVGSQDVPLPNGRTSGNRWTSIGAGPVEILIGAHIDSLRTSPGADDNASGSAILLELARRLATGAVAVPTGTTVTLVWFGAEERLAGRPANDHHFGSRRMAADRAAAGRQPHWMLSVDMVGFGAAPLAVWLDGTDPHAAALLIAASQQAGAPATPSPRGDISDHEAFARRGTPSAMLWRPDNPGYHGPGDTTVRGAALDAGLATAEAFLRTVSDPRRSNRAMVHELYAGLLARRPDLGGVGAATAAIDGRALSVGQVGAGLLTSNEWATAVAPVARLYLVALGRWPDLGGLTAWSGQRRLGWSVPQIAAAFTGSNEFRTRYGGTTDAQFVDALYRNALGRDPDPAGRRHWIHQLACCLTRADAVALFAESSEHRTRTAATLPVGVAYVGLLHRPPDPGGLAFWSSRPLAEVVAGITGSNEFRTRFG